MDMNMMITKIGCVGRKIMLMTDSVGRKVIKPELRRMHLYMTMPAFIPFDVALYYGLALFAITIISPVLSLPESLLTATTWAWFTDSFIVHPVLLRPSSSNSKKIEKLISTACQKHGYLAFFWCSFSLALSNITGVLPRIVCGVSLTVLSVVKLVAVPKDSSRFIYWYMASYIIAAAMSSSSLLQYTMLLPLLVAWAALVIPLDAKELGALFQGLPEDAMQLWRLFLRNFVHKSNATLEAVSTQLDKDYS